MDLREVASISGKSGLFKILKPTRNGVILESLDEHKTKLIASSSSKVSILKEISMYTTGKVANTPLDQILISVKEKYPKGIELDSKVASNDELKSFLKGVLPDFDEEKIYPSDIKKLINWYNVLLKFAPEVFENKEEVAAAEVVDAATEGEVKEKKSTKAKKETTGTATKAKSVGASSKIKSSQNTAQKNVTKSTPSKRGG